MAENYSDLVYSSPDAFVEEPGEYMPWEGEEYESWDDPKYPEPNSADDPWWSGMRSDW